MAVSPRVSARHRWKAWSTTSGQLVTASFMDYTMPRRRPAVVWVVAHHDAVSGQSARRQGMRRGRGDRRVCRRHQCHHRRDYNNKLEMPLHWIGSVRHSR